MTIRDYKTGAIVGHKATRRLIEASKAAGPEGVVLAAKVRGTWDLTIAGGACVYVEGL